MGLKEISSTEVQWEGESKGNCKGEKLRFELSYGSWLSVVCQTRLYIFPKS